jgi:hypothetical protein
LVDGEWISKNSANEAIHQFLIFDIYFAPGNRDVHGLPFYNSEAPTAPQRYNEMRQWEKQDYKEFYHILKATLA